MIESLVKSPHGNLAEYVDGTVRACVEQPEFLAHMISWNRDKGQVRDSKVALPIISASFPGQQGEFLENAIAHLASLNPRMLYQGYRFALDSRKAREVPIYRKDVRGKKKVLVVDHTIQVPRLYPPTSKLNQLVAIYLRAIEEDGGRWHRVAVQHRDSLKSLYSLTHTKPGEYADRILFKQNYPAGSIFADIANLHRMQPLEAAGVILNRKLPFLVIQGALGSAIKDSTIVLALLDRMTADELQTNAKMLERMGVRKNPVLSAAYDQALQRTVKSTRNVLKVAKAIEAVEDEGLKVKLRANLEARKDKISVDGNWLILSDRSTSMAPCIEAARRIAGTLSGLVKGKVHLVFFSDVPTYYDVTSKSYEEITAITQYVTASGWTSIGCGLLGAIQRNAEFDGIVVVTDGGENRAPLFHHVYRAMSKDVPVYVYWIGGNDMTNFGRNLASANIPYQEFNLGDGGNVDYYSLPNLVQTMRIKTYSLYQEIMDTPLLKLADVFNN